MSLLNQQQQAAIEGYLDEQGITFPLRDEMLDHLICDIESHINQGYSFEEAWQTVSGEISASHFRNLQTETMEATSKKFNLSRSFALISLTMLLTASLFKLLQWEHAKILLMGSFGAIVMALIASTISGISLHKQRKGRGVLIGTVAGIILLLISWCMKILQLPGTGLVSILATTLLLVLFPALTIYFRTRSTDDSNLLTYLHEKHTPGINRFLLILLATGVILKLVSVALAYEVGIPNILLGLVIGGAGLQFFALHWHLKPDKVTSAGNYATVVMLIIGFAAFAIPTLPYGLPLSSKVIAAAVFYLLAGILAIHESDRKTSVVIIVGIAWAYVATWTASSLGLIGSPVNTMTFSIPVLIALAGGLVVSYKHRTLLAFMMIVVAHFMYFY